MRVLLIEDDDISAEDTRLVLKRAGIGVDRVGCGEDGIDDAGNDAVDYDLIILDMMLVDMSGFEVLRQLRRGGITTPVLILSGLLTEPDKERGFDLGAFDYVTKPYVPADLVRRIKSMARLGIVPVSKVVSVKGVDFDLDAHTVMVDEHEVHLTPQQFAFIGCLVQRINTVATYDVISERLWPHDAIERDEMKVLISVACNVKKKLRAASGRILFVNVRHHGFRMDSP